MFELAKRMLTEKKNQHLEEMKVIDAKILKSTEKLQARRSEIEKDLRLIEVEEKQFANIKP